MTPSFTFWTYMLITYIIISLVVYFVVWWELRHEYTVITDKRARSTERIVVVGTALAYGVWWPGIFTVIIWHKLHQMIGFFVDSPTKNS